VTPVVIEPADPDHPDARALIGELAVELTRVTGRFTAASYTAQDAHAPRSTFVIARQSDDTRRPLGCGAIRPLAEEHPRVAELKRMYARPGTHGVGHAILIHLETVARELGYSEVWLETGDTNARALEFYTRHGYVPIPCFGTYAGRADCTCLGKRLDVT